MATIDTSTIQNYANMTVEEKLAALEAFNIPEPDYTGYVTKDLFDKTASELSALKKSTSSSSKTSDETIAALKQEVAEMRREKAIADNKAQLIAVGYDEALAEDTATAMADGDMAKVLTNQKSFMEKHDKTVKANLLKGTPTPPGGSGDDTPKTAEDIMKITDPVKRQAAIAENIELFQ